MKLTIPANDFGQIRVFSTEARVEKTPQAIAALFGAELDLSYIDVVDINDLGDMPLTRYVSEGYDMAPDAVDVATLDGTTGTAILVLSRATGGAETELTLAPGLRHVTTYSTPPVMTAPKKLPDVAGATQTKPKQVKPKKSDARMSGMVATYALLAMFALIALMIWVGG